MNTEDYVSYPLALALKDAGFDWECDHYWYKAYANSDEMDMRQASADDFNNDDWNVPHCSAPSLWQAQKWLRERKKLHCQVLLNGVRSMYFWQIRELVGNGKHAESKHQYETYEDAMNDCIAAALGLIAMKGA